MLKDHGIRISMSRKGNPRDNAACESLINTLKYEEVYRTEYRDLAEVHASIGVFLEKVLKRLKRISSSSIHAFLNISRKTIKWSGVFVPLSE